MSVREKPRTERLTRPARQWRNRWRTTVRVYDENGDAFGPGEFVGVNTYPSKEIAEHVATLNLEHNKRSARSFGGRAEYLGAFPVTSP